MQIIIANACESLCEEASARSVIKHVNECQSLYLQEYGLLKTRSTNSTPNGTKQSHAAELNVVLHSVSQIYLTFDWIQN